MIINYYETKGSAGWSKFETYDAWSMIVGVWAIAISFIQSLDSIVWACRALQS